MSACCTSFYRRFRTLVGRALLGKNQHGAGDGAQRGKATAQGHTAPQAGLDAGPKLPAVGPSPTSWALSSLLSHKRVTHQLV